jgi:hypothetical protein
VRTKRLSLFVAIVAFVALGVPASIAAMLYALKGHPAFWLAYAVFFPGIIGLFKAWTDSWCEERGLLRADEAGLWLGDRCVVRREEVRHGYILRRGDRTYVRLGRAIRLVEVEVESEAEGKALLSAMRLDSGRSVGQYAMWYGTWHASLVRAAGAALPVVVAPGVAFLLGGTLPLLFGTLLVAIVLSCLYALNQFVRISVGADGIRVRRPLLPAMVVPFSAIAGASTDGKNVTIRLNDGGVIQMHSPAGQSAKGHGFLRAPIAPSDHVHAGEKLTERIEAQLAVRRARERADAPAFARAGRETDAWLREVAGATDQNASYRTPAVPPDELWRIVEDTTAPATARAGAAAALRQDLDDDGRVRLRAAADACVAPRLRIALETVATPDDDLRTAFDSLEDHEAPQRRALPLPQK